MRYIPDKLFCAMKERTAIRFNNGSEYITLSVHPAFFVDANKENMVSRAESWASGWLGRDEYTAETFQNIEIDDVSIVSIESREKSGRAYKVIIHSLYLVDLREDQFLEAMMKHGIRAGGSFDGAKFIWTCSSGQMKLTFVGGEEYGGSISNESKIKLQQLKPLKRKDLEVGGIYQTKSKHTSLYLGRVRVNGKSELLFCDIFNYDGETSVEKTFEFNKAKLVSSYLESKKSHQYVTKVDSYDNPIFKELAELYQCYIDEVLTPVESYKKNYYNYSEYSEYMLKLSKDFYIKHGVEI